ncbi:MAG: lysophospholipase [Solirubrobacteraceae bacterium]
MTHSEGSLTGIGGLALAWQRWAAPERRALVVIVHGAGEHGGRYEHVAHRLVGEGFDVWALDHRGHGRSDGARALIDRVDHAVSDLDAFVVQASAAAAELPLFMLGHSMGAMIALRYCLSHQDRLAGLVLSGALAALEGVSAPLRAVGRLLSVVAPRAPLIAIEPALISRDPAVVEAYRADPLVHHGKLPARTAAEIADAVESFPGTVGAITLPTLIVYGTADALCPPAGSTMLGERIGADDLTVTAYEGLFHEVLNEPERERVIADVLGWLSARTAGSSGQATAGPAAVTAPSSSRQPLR